jgi:AcrR family transcriptional regulator
MNASADGRTLRHAHRRPEIVRAAAEHAFEHGLTKMSLRQVAQSVGVSHATLVHHFGTKEQLVAEIVDLVLAEPMTMSDLDPDADDVLQVIWQHATTPRGLRHLRLFAEISGEATRGHEAMRQAVQRSTSRRRQALATGLRRRGCPAEECDAVATWLLAAMRGLIGDLLITGEKERVDAAFADIVTGLDTRAGRWTAGG